VSKECEFLVALLSFGDVVAMLTCFVTLFVNGMENLKSAPFGNLRMILPDVMSLPKPS
jgi:hypothetical protein